MKKGIIIGIILGGIIFGTSVYAVSNYLYQSNEVSYTPSDTSWKVSDVKSAIDGLRTTSSNALSSLKDTPIAKAVNANGDSLSSVITTLGNITNRGTLSKSLNPGGSYTLPAGYYSGGTITANSNTETYTPSAHGTALDMGANNKYRYVNTTNVYNQGYNAGVSAPTSIEVVFRKSHSSANDIDDYVYYQTVSSTTGAISNQTSQYTRRFNGVTLVTRQYFTLRYRGSTYDLDYFDLTFTRNVYCNGVAYNSGATITWNYGDTADKVFVITPR